MGKVMERVSAFRINWIFYGNFQEKNIWFSLFNLPKAAAGQESTAAQRQDLR